MASRMTEGSMARKGSLRRQAKTQLQPNAQTSILLVTLQRDPSTISYARTDLSGLSISITLETPTKKCSLFFVKPSHSRTQKIENNLEPGIPIQAPPPAISHLTAQPRLGVVSDLASSKVSGKQPGATAFPTSMIVASVCDQGVTWWFGAGPFQKP